MSDQLYRSYNDFNTGAIYNANNEPVDANKLNEWPGWQYEFSGDEDSTPITDTNLNAMLNMLIYIRNVIGKTEDFAEIINDTEISKPATGYDKDGSGTIIEEHSLATYLKDAFNAIIGTEADSTSESIGRTLAGLKAYLESLDTTISSEDHTWITSITQTDGKITEIGTSQPDASDITYNDTDEDKGSNLKTITKVNDALNKLDNVIGNLSTPDFSKQEINQLDNLIAIIQRVINDRIDEDAALLGTGANDERSTIKKNEASIDAINDETTGILAQAKAYVPTFQSDLRGKDMPENTSSSSPRIWALTPMGGPKKDGQKTRGLQIGKAKFNSKPVLASTYSCKIENIDNLTPANEASYITLARVAELYYSDGGKYKEYIKAEVPENSKNEVTFYWTYPLYFRRVASNGTNNMEKDPNASGGYVGIVTSQNYFEKWKNGEINNNNGTTTTTTINRDDYKAYLFKCYKSFVEDSDDFIADATDLPALDSGKKVRFSFFSVADNEEPIGHSLIVARDPAGQVIADDPICSRHAANKKYVDKTLQEQLDQTIESYRLREKKVFELANAETIPSPGQYYTIAEISTPGSKPGGKGLFSLSVRKSSGARTSALINIQSNAPENIKDVDVTVLSVNHRDGAPVCEKIGVSTNGSIMGIDVFLEPFTRPNNQSNSYQIEITPIDFESSIQTPDNLRISTSADRKIVNLLSHVDAIHTNLVYENINEDLDNVSHGYWFRLAETDLGVKNYNTLLQIDITRKDFLQDGTPEDREVTATCLIAIAGAYADTPDIQILSSASMSWGSALKDIRLIYPEYDSELRNDGLKAYVDLHISTRKPNPNIPKSLITVKVNATNSIGLNYNKELQKLDTVPSEHQDETVYYPSENKGRYTHITKALNNDLTYNFESINEAIRDEIEDRKSEDEKLLGAETDTADANTIYGSKKYTDTKLQELAANVDIDTSKTITNIIQNAGKITVTTDDIQIAQTQVTGLESTLADIESTLATKLDKATYDSYIENKSMSDEELKAYTDDAIKAYTDDEIQKLDVSDTAQENEVVLAVSESNGKIEVSRGSITSSYITNFDDAVKEVKVKNATSADSATKATQDGDGNNIADTYAKKDEIAAINTKVDNIQLLDNKVTLSAPYTFTKDFGYYTLGDASYKQFGEKGQSLRSFLEGAFSQVDNNVLIAPTYSVSISGSTSAEIGTKITPKATVSATAGSYKYGTSEQKKTGITYSNSTLDPASFKELTYTNEKQTLSVTATATRNKATNAPINNLGETIAIPDDIVSDTPVTATASKEFTGYREGCFYGSVADVTSKDAITNWVIRNLEHKLSANYSIKNDLPHTVSAGHTAIIIACPQDKKGPTSILNTTVNAEMIENFKTMTLEVGGADATEASKGEYATNYTVWYYIPAESYKSTASLQIDLG